MALYEVVIKSLFGGQQCVNRWNYIGSGTPAAVSASFALASAMGCIAGGEPPTFPANTMFSKIRDITAFDLEFNEIIVMDVYSVTDFYTTAFPDNTVGADSIAGSSTFEAAGFRTNIVNRGIARGTKRFAGVPDNMINPGGLLNPTLTAKMSILASAMAANLTYNDEGNTITFSPCVVQKEKYTTPSGKSAYRYYPTLAAQMTHVAQGINWEIYDTVRSQTSRQRGRGA